MAPHLGALGGVRRYAPHMYVGEVVLFTFLLLQVATVVLLGVIAMNTGRRSAPTAEELDPDAFREDEVVS